MDFSITPNTSVEGALGCKNFVPPEIGFFVRNTLMREMEDSERFFETGLVTSLFGMQLITFLERRYGFEITDDDLDLENFCTLLNIAAFVERKLG